MSTPTRLSNARAQTAAGGSTKLATAATANPTLSRPLLTPANETSNSLPALESATATNTTPTRPGLFKRITTQLDNALASSTQRERPPTPSHWTDYAHREALLQTWDAINEDAANTKSKYPRSVIGQLVAVRASVMSQFPELAEGEVPLSTDWMEYVLGVGLRHPFCAEGKMMGRWEILSGVGRVGGARAWGPW